MNLIFFFFFWAVLATKIFLGSFGHGYQWWKFWLFWPWLLYWPLWPWMPILKDFPQQLGRVDTFGKSIKLKARSIDLRYFFNFVFDYTWNTASLRIWLGQKFSRKKCHEKAAPMTLVGLILTRNKNCSIASQIQHQPRHRWTPNARWFPTGQLWFSFSTRIVLSESTKWLY